MDFLYLYITILYDEYTKVLGIDIGKDSFEKFYKVKKKIEDVLSNPIEHLRIKVLKQNNDPEVVLKLFYEYCEEVIEGISHVEYVDDFNNKKILNKEEIKEFIEFIKSVNTANILRFVNPCGKDTLNDFLGELEKAYNEA